MRPGLFVLALAFFASPAARAEEDPTAAKVAIATAGSAFEYRDFKKVIDLLTPWVHPPRIADAELMKEARRLLGISLHLEGSPDAAREEFAQVLLQDPGLKLDPFAVPPAVIESFEQVRVRMRPVLDRVLRDRGGGTPIEPLPAVAHAPQSRVAAYLPFGIGHFVVLDQPGWGSLWLALQVVGLAGNMFGYFGARATLDACRPGTTDCHYIAPADRDRYDQLVTTQYAGLALFITAWAASGVQGHLLSGPSPSLEVPARAGPSLSIGPGSLGLAVPF